MAKRSGSARSPIRRPRRPGPFYGGFRERRAGARREKPALGRTALGGSARDPTLGQGWEEVVARGQALSGSLWPTPGAAWRPHHAARPQLSCHAPEPLIRAGSLHTVKRGPDSPAEITDPKLLGLGLEGRGGLGTGWGGPHGKRLKTARGLLWERLGR